MSVTTRKLSLLLASLSTAVLPLQGAQTITIKGSDTMVILNQRWAEAYMARNPGLVVQVTGGGSGTGITSLITGSTDICAASRSMKAEEIEAHRQRQGEAPAEIPVARDGVTIYLNEANPVERLTMAQIKGVYLGLITRWSEVGGPDKRIILYSRENNSGTYMFFLEHVLKDEDFSPFAMSLPGTAAVANAVARDPYSIGYGGSAYAKGIKFCAVSKDEASPAVLPDEDNILSGRYPVSRELFFYTRGTPRGEVKKFTDWVLGPEGQEIVNKVGYFPMRR